MANAVPPTFANAMSPAAGEQTPAKSPCTFMPQGWQFVPASPATAVAPVAVNSVGSYVDPSALPEVAMIWPESLMSWAVHDPPSRPWPRSIRPAAPNSSAWWPSGKYAYPAPVPAPFSAMIAVDPASTPCGTGSAVTVPFE